MLGNCEKMVISSTKEWPQIDETELMGSSGMVMEKASQTQEQALKCPRCDSSNTKFCYYNNYSLSQPRHFCKACKRYWTRGGTLRNVPVGGGCRKNKRIKRPTAAASSDPPPSSLPTPTPTNPSHQIDVSTGSSHINSLFYGLPSNPSDLSLTFPRFHSRVSNMETIPTSSSYDLQPQFNGLGLGFSSATMTSDARDEDYRSGYHPSSQIHDVVTSNSLLSNFSLLGAPSSTSKMILGGLKETAPSNNYFQPLTPFEGLQLAGNGDHGMVMKEVKMEDGSNRMSSNKLEWSQNPIDQIASLDSSLYWSATTVGSWPDLPNYGSSVTPLI